MFSNIFSWFLRCILQHLEIGVGIAGCDLEIVCLPQHVTCGLGQKFIITSRYDHVMWEWSCGIQIDFSVVVTSIQWNSVIRRISGYQQISETALILLVCHDRQVTPTIRSCPLSLHICWTHLRYVTFTFSVCIVTFQSCISLYFNIMCHGMFSLVSG